MCSKRNNERALDLFTRLDRFQKFQAIADWIVRVKSFIVRQQVIALGLKPRALNFFAQFIECNRAERGVRFFRGAEIFF